MRASRQKSSAAPVEQGPAKFFTIGHSNRSAGELIELLRRSGVRTLVDVRSMPRSRAQPQFNAETFPDVLREAGIGYEHFSALGGLRKRSPGVAPDVNGLWENRSFHNYADYAMSDAFRSGLARLRALGRAAPTAIMCAEAVWWRCHRRIIADHLIAAGETVLHILGPDRVERAAPTPGAQMGPNGTVTYPIAS